jgi:cyclopropane fatty-acyl-phospholipid synthase-like methyltransferase
MTSTSDLTGHAQRVRRYYDTNTAAFDRLGQGGASVHRAVWGPGVTSRAEAFHHVDELLLDTLPTGVASPTVVDLGCGLGASLLHLAGRTDIRGEGVTISPRQAAGAARLLAQGGVADRVRCREGNYLALPDDLAGVADLTFSIEAFVHSPDADRYFREAARTLRPGGRLVVCDDFLTATAQPASKRERRWLEEFRTGWRVGSLLSVEQVTVLAAGHGLELVRDLDLTAHLELRRPRDRMISVIAAAGRAVRTNAEYWQSLIGGDALQRALAGGVLSYRFLELRRRAE